MKEFTEAEKQLLITVGWLANRYGLMAGIEAGSESTVENLKRFGNIWFGKYLVDWSEAYENLAAKNYLSETDGIFALTEKGKLARKAIEIDNPLWLYEYNNFFSKAVKSSAHALFCERVYSKNLCQHGLADVFQLNKLLEVLKLNAGYRVLDLGCGNGFITEYLQNQTGAFFQGIDISEEAIKQACQRTTEKNERLSFSVGNMNRLSFEPKIFDCIISIDTLYYVDNLEETMKQTIPILKPFGQMGIFYTQWISNLEDKENLLPENTALAIVLKKHSLKFTALDLTENEAEHWQKKVDVLEELKPQFEKEGNLDLYNYRLNEAVRYANWDLRKRSRYLYHIWLN
ncbi:MAG: class I SAM-dependent methyltransferase [Acidobacteria bacterium]|nr:class I SAM-dependent methyltransferase [Acidobacteriota bacterium]MCA1636819.1 class I SAM-dependent methyltransferase [Acidobacteriota bacterium]